MFFFFATEVLTSILCYRCYCYHFTQSAGKCLSRVLFSLFCSMHCKKNRKSSGWVFPRVHWTIFLQCIKTFIALPKSTVLVWFHSPDTDCSRFAAADLDGMPFTIALFTINLSLYEPNVTESFGCRCAVKHVRMRMSLWFVCFASLRTERPSWFADGQYSNANGRGLGHDWLVCWPAAGKELRPNQTHKFSAGHVLVLGTMAGIRLLWAATGRT